MASERVPVQTIDEGLHPPEKDPFWAESFYLNFSDFGGQLGGFTRMSVQPPKAKTEGVVCLYIPGGGVGLVAHYDVDLQPRPEIIRSREVSHECVRPLEEWRIRYRGDLNVFDDPRDVVHSLEPNRKPSRVVTAELDLAVEGLHAPFFYPHYIQVPSPPAPGKRPPRTFKQKLQVAIRRPGEIVLALRMRSGRHYEQSMAVNGTVTIDGKPYKFHGGGHRDHSWGLRNWGVLAQLRWLSGQMEDFAFNAVFLTIAGTHVTNGYIWRNGQVIQADELVLHNSFDESGIAGREVRLELTAGNEMYVITGNVMLNVPLPFVGPGYSSVYTVGRTQYQWNGRSGYGVAEFLERLKP